MRYIFSILFVCLYMVGYSQIDTATVSLQNGGNQYFIRIGYDVNKVDSAIKVRKFDTSYSPMGIRIRYVDNIIKYYTGTAIVYEAINNGLIKVGKPLKVYLPIDYYDNDKFIAYLKRKLFK